MNGTLLNFFECVSRRRCRSSNPLVPGRLASQIMINGAFFASASCLKASSALFNSTSSLERPNSFHIICIISWSSVSWSTIQTGSVDMWLFFGILLAEISMPARNYFLSVAGELLL